MISAGIESQKTFDLARGKTFCLPLSLMFESQIKMI
jgi:hypothetical protein